LTVIVSDDKEVNALLVVPSTDDLAHPVWVFDDLRHMGRSRNAVSYAVGRDVALRIVLVYGRHSEDSEWVRGQHEAVKLIDPWVLNESKGRGFQISFVDWLDDPADVLDHIRTLNAGPTEQSKVQTHRAESTVEDPFSTVEAPLPTSAAMTVDALGAVETNRLLGWLILAASSASFLIGLASFPDSYFGAGLTFGGGVLAYESLHVLLHMPKKD